MFGTSQHKNFMHDVNLPHEGRLLCDVDKDQEATFPTTPHSFISSPIITSCPLHTYMNTSPANQGLSIMFCIALATMSGVGQTKIRQFVIACIANFV